MSEEPEISIDPTGFITVKNKPSKDELRKHYDDLYSSYLDERKIRKNYQDSYDAIEIKHINLINELCFYSLKKINSIWKTKPGKLLEVGVGEGFTLSKAKTQGWDITGIDFTDSGIKKFNPDISDKIEIGDAFEILKRFSKEGKKFDVCMIQNVLEHVIDPRELINDLKAVTKKNGILLIRVPNDFSKIQAKALELGCIKEKFWVVPPEHLNYFNTKNIKNFMNEMDGKIIDMYSSFPIDIFLLHSSSNYIVNEGLGKSINHARIELELLFAEGGLENFHQLCKSFALCGIGRNISVLVQFN